MPVGYGALRALILAAAFSPEQIERICQLCFGVSIGGITPSTQPIEQVDAMLAYALRYDLIRQLAEITLDAAAGLPAVQNLLLSDDMENTSGPNSQQYFMLRIEAKLDAITERLTVMASEHAEDRRRIHALEMTRTGSPLNWQIIAVTLIVAAMAATATWAMAVR